jgi:hypothetical protein
MASMRGSGRKERQQVKWPERRTGKKNSALASACTERMQEAVSSHGTIAAARQQGSLGRRTIEESVCPNNSCAGLNKIVNGAMEWWFGPHGGQCPDVRQTRVLANRARASGKRPITPVHRQSHPGFCRHRPGELQVEPDSPEHPLPQKPNASWLPFCLGGQPEPTKNPQHQKQPSPARRQ